MPKALEWLLSALIIMLALSVLLLLPAYIRHRRLKAF